MRISPKEKQAVFSLTLLLLSACLYQPALADIIYLKNGRSIEGLVKKEEAGYVELEISFGSMKFSRKQIERIVVSSPAEAADIRKEWVQDKARAEQRAREEERRR